MRLGAALTFGLLLLAASLVPMAKVESSELSDERISFAAPSEMLERAGGSSSIYATQLSQFDFGWIVAGDMKADSQFGTNSLTFRSPTASYGQYANEIFIASIDEQGFWLWAAQVDSSAGVIYMDGIEATPTGEVYVTGWMFGSIGFGSTTLNAANVDVFIAKLDQMGNWQWANVFSTNSSGSSTAAAMGLLPSGDVVLGGYHTDWTDFGGSISLNGSGGEVYLAKFDSVTGSIDWAVNGGGIGFQAAYDVEVTSSGDIYLLGHTTTSTSFGSKSYSPSGNADLFVAKYNSQGTVNAIYGIGGSGTDDTIGFGLASFGSDLYIAGYLTGSVTTQAGQVQVSQGMNDSLLLKMDSSGNFVWGLAGGGSADDQFGAITVLSTGVVVLGGSYENSVTYGGKSVTSNGAIDSWIMGVSSSGSVKWIDSIGGSSNDYTFGVARNSSDIIAHAGGFAQTLTVGSDSITSAGGLDVYIRAFDPAGVIDTDGDGYPDVDDNCPLDMNPSQADYDSDGDGDDCDYDDDNDGITDNSGDDCPRGGHLGWTSNNSTDFDNDGCNDQAEDQDDDNDGILDAEDECDFTSYSPPRDWWTSTPETDMDGDGCRDDDEDFDDDADGVNDGDDDCQFVPGTSTLGGTVGCPDSDSDGWADVDDDCIDQAGNSSKNGTIGCPDSDSDGWADFQDDFPDDETQYLDSDGDGYGDSPTGNSPDDCPNGAPTDNSTEDRLGCPDTDGDGYSDEDEMYTIEDGADALQFEPTQWTDFDGDGLGDNWGNISWSDRPDNWPGDLFPFAMNQDACPIQWGNATQNGYFGCPDADGDGYANFDDRFPNDPSEHMDSDNDKVGDNSDACPNINGTSIHDRVGCIDSDGDGYSDPEFTWTEQDGADFFPGEPTQWASRDNDSYGDNPDGNFPDACPDDAGSSAEDGIYGCPPDMLEELLPDDDQKDDDDDDKDKQDGSVDDSAKSASKEDDSNVLIWVLVGVGVLGAVIGLIFFISGRDEELAQEAKWDHTAIAGAESIHSASAMPVMPAQQVAQPVYHQEAQPVYQAAQPVLAPAAPDQMMQGSMRSDGNEWLEYPDGSGAWYMRDPYTRNWSRKI